jgi:glyoxylase-like metal-dependent hydrolase (beta-lactamase superfamily II)
MIQQILPNLYKVEVPLPGNPLKATNSYLIKTREQNLIIDTGMNREECMKAIRVALRKLDIGLEKTDFFITHFHADHLGLVPNLATASSKIYFNRIEANLLYNIRAIDYRENLIRNARLNGFPENKLLEIFAKHPAYRYGVSSYLDFSVVKEGDLIRIGDYMFKCIETPGHSPGHICLYECEKKIFISGDHILEEITPNVSLWSYEGNPLAEYLASLDKISGLDVAIVLPGHRHIFKDYKKRIRELKEHHQRRLNEIISILKAGGKNAFQIASQMSWDMNYDSWELFPTLQKWFAFGEALAHLKYLEEKKIVRRNVKDETVFFEVAVNKS